MKELNELVQAKLNEMAQSGAIEKLISDKVEGLVADALSDTFRSYSPLSKKLKESLENGLSINFDEIDYPSYNAIMLGAVQGHISKYFEGQVIKNLDDQITTLLGAPDKEMSISDLTDNLIEIIKSNMDSDFRFDDTYSAGVRVSSESNHGKSLKIRLDDNVISKPNLVHLYLGEDGSKIRINHMHDGFNPTMAYGLENLLNAYIFKLYAAKTKIIGWDSFDPCDHDFDFDEL